MNGQTGDILASIDATLEGWHTWDPDVSNDAMRWTPDEPAEDPGGAALGDWAVVPTISSVAAPTTAELNDDLLAAYARRLDIQLAEQLPRGSAFAAAYVEHVVAPQMKALGIALNRVICEVVRPAVQETAAAISRVARAFDIPVEHLVPDDRRARALQAIRSRGTGPAAPRLDGRRR